MTTRLLYVMDPMCSWCWGFAPVLEALAEQAQRVGVPLHLVAGGLRRERRALDAPGRTKILGHWQAVQLASGQPFNFTEGLPQGLVYDTEPACRALVSARGLDAQRVWPLAKLIQQAFYVDGHDVTQTRLLVALAEQAGLARDAFAEAFDSAEAVAATAADCGWAQDLGISGFPTLLAEHNGQLALLTNGYQPLPELAPLLARWLERAIDA